MDIQNITPGVVDINVTENINTTPTGNTSDLQGVVSISSTSSIKTTYYTIGCIGVIGNLFVVIVILQNTTLRSKLANIYIVNQSLIDLLAAVMLIASTTITDNTVIYSGLAGQLYCKLWLTKVILWGLLVSSTYNLLSLTLERYLGVVHPTWHKINFSKRKAVGFLIGSWLIGLLYNIAYMVPTSVIVGDQCHVYSRWPSNTVRVSFGLLTCIIQFFIPLGVMIVCYSRIVFVIRSKSKVSHSANVPSGGSSVGTANWSKAKRNTIKTLLLVSLCFVICWAWNQIIFTMFNLGYQEDYSSDFYHFTVVAVFCNCCVNPFVYSLKYEQFQLAAKQMFCGKRSSSGEQYHTSDNTYVDGSSVQ